MRSIEYSSQGVWVANVPPIKRVDEFPPCHPVFDSMKWWQKSFWRHYDINNLTQDYRKEKEEWKETMALEVVTGGKNDKTEQND